MNLSKEYAIILPVKKGMKSKTVKLIQEWLSLSGYAVRCDGDFGAGTAKAVEMFCLSHGINQDYVDEKVFSLLIQPLHRAIALPASEASLGPMIVKIAMQHLAEHPREIGGQNAGPWVRWYTRGPEGNAYPWCAGFVSSILNQACKAQKINLPLPYTLSCDVLAAKAQAANIFLTEKKAPALLKPGSIFLNIRKSGADWDHTGFVIAVHKDSIETIEGNTNDEGSREGYEVCRRFRSLSGKDYILL
jgi:peptidoglycan hydrolase-like protein with peptidoglycan-binding domain